MGPHPRLRAYVADTATVKLKTSVTVTVTAAAPSLPWSSGHPELLTDSKTHSHLESTRFGQMDRGSNLSSATDQPA